MREETKTAIISSTTKLISELSTIKGLVPHNKEEVAQIKAIQHDLAQLAIKIINQPKLKQISYFLKTVKYHWHISDSLIKKLAVKFNCEFNTLKFQIQWNGHSDGFNGTNHQENI